MLCDTEEQLKNNVLKTAIQYNEYKNTAHLQYEFVEKHIKFEDGGWRI